MQYPIPRANPSPEVTDPFCRLPLPTFDPWTRGCSPWRPVADIGTDIECCIKLIKQARFSRFYRKNSDIPKNSKCSINHIPPSLIESIQGECIDKININLNELIIILKVLIVKKKR